MVGDTCLERYSRAMCESVAHWGPDGSQIWLPPDNRVGSDHGRLSVFDLSVAGNQPMVNADGGIQLVFNGGIYDHAKTAVRSKPPPNFTGAPNSPTPKRSGSFGKN